MKRVLTILFLTLTKTAVADTLPEKNAVFQEPNMSLVQLGQLLFYDPILSGNKTVSCATCHHPRFGTSDGLSLGIGDGGIGLGPNRIIDPQNPPEQRIPRNAPSLFNLGATEFNVMFHDGRLEADVNEPNGIRTPLGGDMTVGFANLLSAQTMFPVLSPDEMAGHYSENDVAQAVRQGFLTGPNGAWSILAKRIADIPEYQTRFNDILGPEHPIHFTDISDAIAAFMAFEWRADDSLFDRYLAGAATLDPDQSRGLALFYGEAGCSACHSGQFQTDHAFHSIGMPQIGPGKSARFERHQRDVGRMRVTGASTDAYAFRTPSLRNVTHTAPYGHAGAFATLSAVIAHHAEPTQSLADYRLEQSKLPEMPTTNDFAIHDDLTEISAIASSINFKPNPLTSAEIDDLIAFLGTLTDPQAITGRLGIPERVPSGLSIER